MGLTPAEQELRRQRIRQVAYGKPLPTPPKAAPSPPPPREWKPSPGGLVFGLTRGVGFEITTPAGELLQVRVEHQRHDGRELDRGKRRIRILAPEGWDIKRRTFDRFDPPPARADRQTTDATPARNAG